jgi:hypothetical protein
MPAKLTCFLRRKRQSSELLLPGILVIRGRRDGAILGRQLAGFFQGSFATKRKQVWKTIKKLIVCPKFLVSVWNDSNEQLQPLLLNHTSFVLMSVGIEVTKSKKHRKKMFDRTYTSSSCRSS